MIVKKNLKKENKNNGATPYDMLWKEIISEMIFSFTEFFTPKLYSEIETSVEPEFKEQEFHKLVASEAKGKNITDKLVKFQLKTGNKKFLFIHIEIQASYQTDFNERMFKYFYRIIDKYGLKHNDIEVIAVFLKPDMHKTGKSNYNYIGKYTSIDFKYQIYNILDFYTKTELLVNKNPFALVMLASRYALEYKNEATQQYKTT